MNSLFEYLHRFQSLSDTALQHLQQVAVRRHYPAKYYLLHIGDVCEHVHLVEKGVLRAYYVNEANEDITSWLAAEHDVITQPLSLHHQEASLEGIEVIEDATLWSIHLNDLRKLQNQYHEVALISLQLQQRYLIRYQERLLALLRLSTDQRYARFCEVFPHLLQRIPLKYIASYLGMTPSTLSHLRADITKRQGKGMG